MEDSIPFEFYSYSIYDLFAKSESYISENDYSQIGHFSKTSYQSAGVCASGPNCQEDKSRKMVWVQEFVISLSNIQDSILKIAMI